MTAFEFGKHRCKRCRAVDQQFDLVAAAQNFLFALKDRQMPVELPCRPSARTARSAAALSPLPIRPSPSRVVVVAIRAADATPGLEGADTAGNVVLQEQSGNAQTMSAGNEVLRAVPDPIFEGLRGRLVGRTLGNAQSERPERRAIPCPPLGAL